MRRSPHITIQNIYFKIELAQQPSIALLCGGIFLRSLPNRIEISLSSFGIYLWKKNFHCALESFALCVQIVRNRFLYWDTFYGWSHLYEARPWICGQFHYIYIFNPGYIHSWICRFQWFYWFLQWCVCVGLSLEPFQYTAKIWYIQFIFVTHCKSLCLHRKYAKDSNTILEKCSVFRKERHNFHISVDVLRLQNITHVNVYLVNFLTKYAINAQKQLFW